MKLELSLGKLFIFLVLFIYSVSYANFNTIIVDPAGDNDCSDNECNLPSAIEKAEQGEATFFLILRPGNYNLNTTINYTPTKSKTLIIRAEDPTNPPVINSTVGNPILLIYNTMEDEGTYIRIENIIFSSGSSNLYMPAFIYVRTFKANVEIYRCQFLDGSGSKGIEIVTDSGHIRLLKNIFSNSTFSGDFIVAKTFSGSIEIAFTQALTSVSSENLITIVSLLGDTIVKGNRINNSSGRALHISAQAGNVLVESNLIKNSSIQDKGGAIYAQIKEGTIIFRNNLLYGNSGIEGGSIYISSDNAVIYMINNTIYNNSADKGGGVFILLNSDTAKAYIYNNILWNNTATSGGNDGDDLYIESDGDNNGAGSEVDLSNNNLGTNSDFSTGSSEDLFISNTSSYSQSSNIQTDPVFSDPSNEDFSLQATSPMIDAGSNNIANVPLEDIRGSVRSNPDIGAYEYKQLLDPDISLHPSSILLNSIYKGSSVITTVYLYNEGGSNLTVNSISIDNTSQFNITEDCTSIQVTPGNYCTINVTFLANTTGTFNATLTINSDDPNESNITLNIVGNSIDTTPKIIVYSQNIISASVGGYASFDVTVRNEGTSDLIVDNVYIEKDILNEFYINMTLIQINPCGPIPFTLNPGQQCKFRIIFIPKVESFRLVHLVIESNDKSNDIKKLDIYANSSTINIFNLEIVPQEYNFGHVLTGFTSEILEINIMNMGQTNHSGNILTIEYIILEYTENFQILEDKCSGKSLKPFNGCSVKVIFKPTYEGTHRDNLILYTDMGIFKVELKGKSTEGVNLEISPSQIIFGKVKAGNVSSKIKVYLNNKGNFDLRFSKVYVEDTKHFFIDQNSCNTLLKPGDSCYLNIYFKPSTYGSYKSSLVIELNEPQKLTYKVNMEGEGDKLEPKLIKEIRKKGCSTTTAPFYFITSLLFIFIIAFKRRKVN